MTKRVENLYDTLAHLVVPGVVEFTPREATGKEPRLQKLLTSMRGLLAENWYECVAGDDFFIPFDELLEENNMHWEEDETCGCNTPEDAQQLMTLLWAKAIQDDPAYGLHHADAMSKLLDVTINGL